MFTVLYELIIYIRQITFRLKRLKAHCHIFQFFFIFKFYYFGNDKCECKTTEEFCPIKYHEHSLFCLSALEVGGSSLSNSGILTPLPRGDTVPVVQKSLWLSVGSSTLNFGRHTVYPIPNAPDKFTLNKCKYKTANSEICRLQVSRIHVCRLGIIYRLIKLVFQCNQ